MREHIIPFVVYLLYLYVPIKYSCLIYQQQHYHMDRYLFWLKNNWARKQVARIALLLCVSYVTFLIPVSLRQEGFFLLVLVIAYLSYKVECQVHYRVPLSYTPRIKRFLLVDVIVHCIGVCLLVLCPLSIQILASPLLFASPFLFILISGQLANPIEYQIQERFVKEAKDILRRQNDLLTIGITGSFGKTSVKHILYTLLSGTFSTVMTPKSYNNKMGITLTIRQHLRPLHEVFLCEMGADHVGEIKDLMSFVQPEIGIVTAIGPQHLQTFHTMDNIIKEKMLMVEALPTHGIGFLNADNVYIRSHPLRTTCDIVWFGKDKLADYRIYSMESTRTGTSFTILHHGERYHFTTCLLGEHNVYNICCGIAVAHRLGVSFEQLQSLVPQLPYVPHRLQIVSTTPYTLIDDAYNANPVGARNALEVMAQMKERVIIITPGMIDLGEREQIENRLFGKHMAHCVDDVILVGETRSKPIKQGLLEEGFSKEHLYVCDHFDQAYTLMQEIVKEGDVVLLENDLPDAFAH